jgi:hypothetical protein
MKHSTRAELADIARRWIEEGWKKGNVAAIDEIHAADAGKS